MKNFSFTKMSGAGNDFILFDLKNNPELKLNAGNIKSLCDRRNGIGADGVITISDSEKYNFEMMYFNADGSTGSLCGNGSRCAIKFAELTGRLKNGKADFISNNKFYKGEVIKRDQIKFYLDSPTDIKYNFNLNVFNQTIKADFINTGSPHVIIDITNIPRDNKKENNFSDLNDVPVFRLGREIRYHNEFVPDGTNVNFMALNKENVLIRTYERGVEDETLSCGTGSVATAIIASIKYKISPPVNMLTRGGDLLIVDFALKNDLIENVSLTGPVKQTFSGQIEGTIFV